MTISYILIVFYLLIIISFFVFPKRLLFKHCIASFISLILCGLYIYLDTLSTYFNSINFLGNLLADFFKPLFILLNVNLESYLMLGKTIFIFVLFILIYIISYIIVSLTSIGLENSKHPFLNYQKIIFGLIYSFCLIFETSFFISNFTPLFKIETGILSSFINFFQRLLI